MLYDGRLEDVFFRLQAYYNNRNSLIMRGYLPGIDINTSHRNLETTYIAVKFVSLLVKKPVDLLFGEDPTFSSGSEADSPEQKALERHVEENDLTTSLMELGLGTAIRGDGVLKVRIDPDDPHPLIIEPQDAMYWIPETDPGNHRDIEVHHICVPVIIRNPMDSLDATFNFPNPPDAKFFLRVESHYRGQIVNRLFRLNPRGLDMFGQPDYTIEEELPLDRMFPDLDQTIETGVDHHLIVHIPNTRTDIDLYGADDVEELKPLLDELANRLTQIAQILDKHADPIIALPAGTMETRVDSAGNTEYVYRASANKAIEVDSKEDMIPQYITWDGKIDAAFKEMEHVIDMIFMIAEIPRMIVGGTSAGGGMSHTDAQTTKYRLLPLLAKVNRKKRYLDKGIRHALYVAQLLEQAYVKVYGTNTIPDYVPYQPTYPKIVWADGLPKDDLQEAQIMQIRTGNEPTLDPLEAIMRLDSKTEDQAKQTLDKIRQAQQEAAVIDSAARADTAANSPSAKEQFPLGA